MNELVFALTVICIISINIILAFIRKKGDKMTLLKYVANPNKNTSLIISLTLTGTIVGGGMFLATGQMGYESRYIGLVLGLVYVVGLTVMGYASKSIRKLMTNLECYSLIDLLSLKYSKKVVIQFTIINFFMYLFLLASQYVAMIELLHFLEPRMSMSYIPYILITLGILALFLYPIIGGIEKDIQTDIVQMIVISIAVILIATQLFSNNALFEVFSSEGNFTPPAKNNFGLIFIIGAIIFLTPSFFVRMDMWQRINTSKTSKDSFKGFAIAGLLSLFFFVIFSLIGSYANTLNIPESSYSSLNAIFELFNNSIALGFIIGAFFAAVLSSADTLINNVSIFATKLLFPSLNFSKEKDSNGVILKYSRLSGIVLSLLALVLSFIVPDIVDLIIGAFSLLLIFLPTILGILFNHNNSNAAFYSGLVGFIIFIIGFIFWNEKLAFVPGVVISFIIYFTLLFIKIRPKTS